MQKIQRLQQQGVAVAEGEGSTLQKTIVLSALVISSVLIFVNGGRNPVFFVMLPLVIIAIDFLSGFVHWFFDTQVEPSDTFLGRIAIDFLDHHIRPGRTAEVSFIVSAHRPALLVTVPLVSLSTIVALPTVAVRQSSGSVFSPCWYRKPTRKHTCVTITPERPGCKEVD